MSTALDPEFGTALCGTSADLLRCQRTAASPFVPLNLVTRHELLVESTS